MAPTSCAIRTVALARQERQGQGGGASEIEIKFVEESLRRHIGQRLGLRPSGIGNHRGRSAAGDDGGNRSRHRRIVQEIELMDLRRRQSREIGARQVAGDYGGGAGREGLDKGSADAARRASDHHPVAAEIDHDVHNTPVPAMRHPACPHLPAGCGALYHCVSSRGAIAFVATTPATIVFA